MMHPFISLSFLLLWFASNCYFFHCAELNVSEIVLSEAFDADHLTPPKPSKEENITHEVTPVGVIDASLQPGAPPKKKRKLIAQVSISTVLLSHCCYFV